MAVLWTAASMNTWKEHVDFTRTTRVAGQWGVSGSLHLEAGAGIREANPDTLTTQTQ